MKRTIDIPPAAAEGTMRARPQLTSFRFVCATVGEFQVEGHLKI
jgi:hypothetical protein